MKSLLVILSLLTAQVAHAGPPLGSITCETADANHLQLKLTADYIQMMPDKNGKIQTRMFNVTFAATSLDYTQELRTEVGRAMYLDADQDYNPKKYKNHVRFGMHNLVNETEEGAFYPMDSCTIRVMIPTDAFEKGSFQAPTIVSCDQSGGTQVLSCQLTPISE